MLELHELYVSAAWVNAVAGVMVYVLSSPFKEPGSRTWALSWGVAALGCLFLAYGEHSGAWISGGLTSAVIAAPSILRFVAINQVTGKKTSTTSVLVYVLVLLLLAVLAGMAGPQTVPNNLGAAVLNVLLCPQSIRALCGRAQRPQTACHWGLSAFLLLLLLVSVSDVVAGLDAIRSGHVATAEGNQFATFIVLLVLAAGSSGAFLNLTLARWVSRFQVLTAQLSEAKLAAEKQALLARFDRDTTLNQMSGSLVHEVSQPISALLAQAQFTQFALAAGKLGASEVPIQIDKIISSARRATAMLNRFRSFSRGEPNLEFRVLSLGASVAATVKLLLPQLKLKGISVEFAKDAGKDLVLVDDLILAQVVMNLVRNAENAMQAVPNKQLSIRVRTDSTSATLEVRDSGAGLALNSDESTDDFHPGLGLRIVREAVSAFGGHFVLENSATGGALASVTLPLVSDESSARGADHTNLPGAQ